MSAACQEPANLRGGQSLADNITLQLSRRREGRLFLLLLSASYLLWSSSTVAAQPETGGTSCFEAYKQCGGLGFTTSQTCCDGYRCQSKDAFFSE